MLIKKSNYPLGIDISDLSIKLVQLTKLHDKINIQSLGRIDIPAKLIEQGDITNIDEVSKYINKLLTKPQFGIVTSNEVVVCLPEPKTFIKLIKVEDSPNKIENIISAEIEKNIPVSINDLYYDWQIIFSDQDVSYVLIGAAPCNIVDNYLELLRRCKLNVIAFEIEAMPIARCLLREESQEKSSEYQKNYALIDIGAKRTSMIIYSRGTIVSTINMPISGEDVTAKIAQTLEIKNNQAEKAKIICGLDKTKAQGIISDILSDMLTQLTVKIKSNIDYYNDNYAELGPISEIQICGGGSNIKNLADIIQEKTNLATIPGNVFTNIYYNEKILAKLFIETHNIDLKLIKNKQGKKVTIKQNSSLTYATAIGLALRGVFLNNS